MAVREQVRITLPEQLRQRVEPIRRQWDPDRAAHNPAHVTVIYHDEADDPGLLRARLRTVTESWPRFALRLGAARVFGVPSRGIYLETDDCEQGTRRPRDAVLGPPFRPRGDFVSHVTLLHPERGARGDEAWQRLCDWRIDASFAVEAFEIIQGEKGAARTVARYALAR